MLQAIDSIDQRLQKVTSAIARVCTTAAGGLLLGMILLTAIAVMARYFFRRPIVGAEEVLTLSLVGLIWLVLPEVELRGRHIKSTILVDRFSTHTRLVLDGALSIINIAIMALITWSIIQLAYKNLAEGHLSMILRVPLGAVMIVLAIGASVSGIAFLSTFVHKLKDVVRAGRRMVWLLVLGCAIVVALFLMPLLYGLLPGGIDRFVVGLVGFAFMLVILFLGAPIGSAMFLTAYLGTAYIVSMKASLSNLALIPFDVGVTYTWVVVPLFIAMGNLLYHADLGRDLYSTVNKWIGHLPGGLAMATIGACASFAAACGESLATAVTMGTVALPEMRRYKYDSKIATGAVAAGGTLGILIPPSIGFIVYGIITEQSIGRLFMAGIIPGIMLASFFMLVIYVRVRMNPSLALPAPRHNMKERLASLPSGLPILALFVLVVGGIYAGLFAPSEGGGIGAFGVLLIGLIMARYTWRKLGEAVRDAVVTNASVFYIFTAAITFGYFVTVSHVPLRLSDILMSVPAGRYTILSLILLMYILLGCVMNILPAMIITLPIIFPTVEALGFDPIWFGVIMVITMEMGQITPPVGINVFGIAGIVPDVPMGTIFRGIVPFFGMMLLAILVLLLFPGIATFLPNLLYP